jgi:hypothetical protein
MPNKEIKLNKQQFKLFNDDDQFNLFCDDDGYGTYENFNDEVDNLFEKYDYIAVSFDDYIYGIKNSKKEELSDQAFDGYQIALEIISDN